MTIDAANLRRLSPLLDEAIRLDEPGRDAWLDALRGDAAELAPLLRELLARHTSKETSDLLDRRPEFPAPCDRAASDAATFTAGDMVGPYVLLREIGSGGMGEVWLAERSDGQLKRVVALKLPTLGLRRSVLVQRFARERDILGSLAHPHIARLYDAGLADDGQPFLALEYVEGLPITRYCLERRLDARARVVLLLQVMDAVQYAHAHLVIHRDLKPSNVLVTAAGHAMLLDFGIAKLLQEEQEQAHETELTRLGGRALTLHYAAPEQLAGAPVSIVTDVYALGVLLYELLAGRRPFEGERRGVETAVLTEEAARPQSVADDLATIALKALKKSPAERYQTVNSFADDLNRWLRDEPVLAQPDSSGYRVRKFIGRNRLAVGAAGVVAMVVVTAAAVSIWQARVALEQTRIARSEAKTSEAVQNFLEGIFKANSGEQADPVAARERPARELLDEGAARIDRALDEAPGAKLRVLRTLANMYEDMGMLDQSARLYERSAALAQTVYGEGSDAHLQALADLGHKLMDSDRYDEARAVIGRAERLAAARPDTDPAVSGQVDLHLAALHRWDDPQSGLAAAERAVVKLRAVPTSPNLLVALQWYAILLVDQDQSAKAVKALEEAVSVAPSTPAGGRSTLPGVYAAWARAAEKLGDIDGADELYRQAVTVSEANTGPASVETVHIMAVHGLMLGRHGQLRRGVELAGTARARAFAWRDSPDRRTMLPILATYEAQMRVPLGQLESVIELTDQGLRSFGPPEARPSRAVALHNVRAMAMVDLGRFAEAAAELDLAQDLTRRFKMASGHAQLNARIRVQWLIARGDGGRAAESWRRYLADTARPDPPLADDHEALTDVAEVLLAAGDAQGASERARQALVLLERRPARTDNADVEARALRLHGAALLRLGQPAKAVTSLRRSAELHDAVYDPQLSPSVAQVQVLLGEAQLATGDRTAARDALARAQAIRARHAELGPQYLEPIRRLQADLTARR